MIFKKRISISFLTLALFLYIQAAIGLLAGMLLGCTPGTCTPQEAIEALDRLAVAQARLKAADADDVEAYRQEVEALLDAVEFAQRCAPKKP